MNVFGLLEAAAIVTILFSFITGFAIPHRNIELFTHFRLQYFVISILLMLLFAVLRDPVLAGALLLTALFNATFILPWYFNRATGSSGTLLKFVHANVRSSNSDYQRLLDFIADEDPDVIFLQEVTPDWHDGIRELSQKYPHGLSESRQGNFGIALYSKTPLRSVRHIDSPPLGHPTIIAVTTISGEQVTLISTHPAIPVGRDLYAARNEHLESVAALVRQTQGKIVLLGDFNASIWCAHYRQLEKSTGLRNTRKGFGILPSWPTFLPFAMIPIDHALVSSEIDVVAMKTGKRIGSDHLPLIVTLSF
ncbi:MAG: endonuclease/exonuclease/phosphatase family protein [Proteobacteria bacterium]|nr:endonuclease/exonuclease/phosphatase family protein [Pseudomonadota bacterium]